MTCWIVPKLAMDAKMAITPLLTEDSTRQMKVTLALVELETKMMDGKKDTKTRYKLVLK